MAGLLYRIGRFSARRAWAVVTAWVVVLALAVGAYLAFGGQLTSAVTIPGTATERVTEQLAAEFTPDGEDLARSVVAVVAETLSQEREERVVVAGASHLARSAGADFPHTIGPVLEALEEQVVLLRLLGEMAEDEAAVSVRIGRETQHEGLVETSFVTTGYGGPDGGGTAVARIGSVGPLRMDYPGTIASVRAVARYLSRILAG